MDTRDESEDRFPQAVRESAEASGMTRDPLDERLQFERLISDLSAAFLTGPPDRVDDEVVRVLDRVSRFFGADHCSLLEVLGDDKRVSVVNINVHQGAPREVLSVDIASGHPWAYHRLVEHGEPVIFSSLDELPPEAGADRAAWEREDVHALLMLPLRVGGQVTHLIGLPSHRAGHEWPAIDMQRLRVLGEIFASGTISRRAQEALRRSEHGLAEAQRIAHLGSWTWNIPRGEVECSDEIYRIFGLDRDTFGTASAAFLTVVHPDDRETVEQALAACLADARVAYDIEHRVVRPDGSVRVVHARGRVEQNVDGKPAFMVGTVLDITERKQTEEALQKALDEVNTYKGQLQAENIYLRQEMGVGSGFSHIVGTSDEIEYVKFRVRQVAQTKATALLTGETGTGKGVFARALHEASNRKGKPFVHVNCAGLPPNLIESELFGREKGAFTGSTARQIGRFELANGGTIYLDEIGELPPELQAKLLKVLEDGEFERLGSPHPVTVDVRVVASTNRQLEDEVKAGRFRKDLFYRLNVFPVTIPPLRRRREDIQLLANFYVHKFGKSYGKVIKRIPKEIMTAFETHSWPGNVRELINVVERAVIVSDGPVLRLAEQITTPTHLQAPSANTSGNPDRPDAASLAKIEHQHILQTLQETGWTIEGPRGAAQILQMHPSTVRARMKKLGIVRPNQPPRRSATPPAAPMSASE